MLALILDDSSTARSVLARRLRELGIDAVAAPDVATALELLDDVGPLPLALVDWNLPGRNGLDFVAAVRSDPRHADMKILMVTTELGIDHVLQALDVGVDEYLMKPFTRETLSSKLALIGLPGRDFGRGGGR